MRTRKTMGKDGGSRDLANKAEIKLLEYLEEILGSFEKLNYADYQEEYEKVERYFLSGERATEWPFKWKEPLSPMILKTIIEAKKTQRFVRFEIWVPYQLESKTWSFWRGTRKKYAKVNNGVVVGFIAWIDSWGSVYVRDGHIDEWGDGEWTQDKMDECRATYLICKL